MKQTIAQKRWITPQSQQLFSVISKLKSKSEIRNFFRDLLTESEIKEFSARWRAAQMLNNNIPYTKIVSVTGLSSTTVARVQRWLKGGTGGYRSMILRINRQWWPLWNINLTYRNITIINPFVKRLISVSVVDPYTAELNPFSKGIFFLKRRQLHYQSEVPDVLTDLSLYCLDS